MSEPFLGQIEIFSFGFAPRGWALCAGQLMSIQQNQALFAVLGTTFGGNGINTFALPDLRGRTAIGQGNGGGLTPRVVGQTVGEETHTLLISETPAHTHALRTLAAPDLTKNTDIPGHTGVLAQTKGTDKDNKPITVNVYALDGAPNQQMAGAAIGTIGGQPHPNIMPYLAVNACIALQGIFPSRN